MAEIVQMPKMSDTMTEGVIAAWHKKVGDTVESGELMAEIETDKATMEYESYNDGVVLYLGGQEGDAIPVDGVLAIVGDAGEDYKALLDQALNGTSGGSQAESAEPAVAVAAPAASAEKIDTSGINAEIVRMPKMSDTMTQGVIASWHKKVGDTVESGELMAEIETDKATMEYESYNDGTVLYLGAEAGGTVDVDGVLAIVGEAGADYETLLKAESQNAAAPAAVAQEEAPKATSETKEEPKKAASKAKTGLSAAESGERVKASPLAKKLAAEKGYDLAQIPGSGPNGRVIKEDVEGFTPAPAASAAAGSTVVGEESFEEVRVSQMRKTIARRLADSKYNAPHFYLTMEIDMDNSIKARKSLNEVSPVKISFNDMVVRAVAAALKQHPGVNSSWQGDTIRVNHHVNIGVAVAVPDGLVVPVVRFADAKSLSQISQEVKELAGKAKDKKLQPAEMEGSTFTISNLGMFGIDQFTGIINSPDACILAVGGIKQTPVVKDGQLVPGNIMKVTLSCDHRVVDGAVGAAFLQTFKNLIEDPVRILI